MDTGSFSLSFRWNLNSANSLCENLLFFYLLLQGVVKVLLPIDNPNSNFLAVFSVCIVAKSLQVSAWKYNYEALIAGFLILMQVGLIVYLQCNVDVFFMDWEVRSLTFSGK